jgi:hypothetical protein
VTRSSTFDDLVQQEISQYMRTHREVPDRNAYVDIVARIIGAETDPAPEFTALIISSANANAVENRGRRRGSVHLEEKATRVLTRYRDFIDVAHEVYRRLVMAFVGWAPEHRNSADDDILDEAILKPLMLLSMYSRGCVIGAEIEMLFQNGFFDGARSRVRTLYETSIICSVLATDTSHDLAGRFYASGMLERRADLQAHRLSHEELGWPLPLEEEFAEVEAQCDLLLSRYGREIRQPFGWARPLFPDRSERHRITFADVEHVAGGQYRTVYRMLNHSVHSGPSITAAYLYFDPQPSPIEQSYKMTDASLIIGGATAFLLQLHDSVCIEIASTMEAPDEFLTTRALISKKVLVGEALTS